jgi:hypothetical protein
MDIPSAELQAPSSPLRVLPDTDGVELAIYGEALVKGGVGALPNLKYLWLSGASSEACRIAGTIRSLRRLVVHDWRAPDLKHLSRLVELESLAIAGAPRLKSLDGIGELADLQSLILSDCCGYTSLKPIQNLVGLRTLCLEGGFSTILRVESFEPIGALKKLERLRLASVKVQDKSLRPLRALKMLRDVFINDLFSVAEMRGLAAALPLARGEFLDSHRHAS